MERHRYIGHLSTEERQELEAIVKKGKGEAHKIPNAQILLHSDENGERLTVQAIARLLHCNKDPLNEEDKGQFLRGAGGENPINKFRGLELGRIISKSAIALGERASRLEINVFTLSINKFRGLKPL